MSPPPPPPLHLPQPAPGLHNCLHAAGPHISLLGASGYAIRTHPGALSSTLHPPHALVHAAAAASPSIFAAVVEGHVVVNTAPPSLPQRSDQRLHFIPQDIAVATVRTAVLAAVAGYDGVYLWSPRPNHLSLGPMRLLPGSTSHPCVAVAVSSTGSIAAATMDGRRAVWSPSERSPTSAPSLAFVTHEAPATVFDAPIDNPMGDRVTQIAFSPRTVPVEHFAVAWWSGRLEVFRKVVDDEWAPAWRFPLASKKETIPRNLDFGSGPGSFVAFCVHAPVVAFSVGNGRLYFIALHNSCSYIEHLFSGSPAILREIKGLAAFPSSVLAWSRVEADVVSVPWPINSLQLTSKSTSLNIPRSDLSALRETEGKSSWIATEDRAVSTQLAQPERLFAGFGVRISQRRGSGKLERWVHGSRKSAEIPLPLMAKAIRITSTYDSMESAQIDDVELPVQSLTATKDLVVIVIGHIMLVHSSVAGQWHAVSLVLPMQVCAVATESTPSPRCVLFAASREGDAWQWDAESLQKLHDAPLRLHSGVTYAVGCLNGTLAFATLSVPNDDRTQILSLVSMRSPGSDTNIVQHVQLRQRTIRKPIALWCDVSSARAVIMFELHDGQFSAASFLLSPLTLDLELDLPGVAPGTALIKIAADAKLPHCLLAGKKSMRSR